MDLSSTYFHKFLNVSVKFTPRFQAMKDSSLMSRIGFFKKYFQPVTNITPKYVEIWVNFQMPKNCVAIV